MKEDIAERTVQIARFIVEKNATVRCAAQAFGLSKSTVHKDITERLPHLHPMLAHAARTILDLNKSQRHIRGGLATQNKYRKQAGGSA